jgi:deoxyhypusine monooxygenase
LALTKTLLDPTLSLFVRYRALFTLRNIGTPAAIDALSSAMLSPNEICSPLFKHEVAFVFGQMSDPHSVPALLKVLEDEREEDMVRHEAAEALGGIATDEVLPVLRRWAAKEDAPRVVRESCVVAIDMWEVCNSPDLHLRRPSLVYQYENSNQFQYANGLNRAGLVQATA